MTHDELAVLEAMRTFPRGRHVTQQALADKTRLPADRVQRALKGLDDSGHVWLEGDKARLSSDGTTFDT